MEVVPEKGARACICALKRERQRVLGKIPPKFREIRIDDLEPMPARHKTQVDHVPFIKANPDRSYFLAGDPGTGKSTFMWALYRHAIEKGETRVVICTLSELLDEYRNFIGASMRNDDPKMPRLSPWELKTEQKFSIFLDDIDKANPTDYAAEQIFNLVNAVYEFRHQLVVTTNKTVDRLIAHYDRSDHRGEAIVRRMLDGAKVIQMF